MSEKEIKKCTNMQGEIHRLYKSTAITRHRKISAYVDAMENLKTEFYKRWERRRISSSHGLENLEKIAVLGTGGFGRVFLVMQKETKQHYAMKVIEKIKIIQLKQVEHSLNEKKILESIRYPFIISLEFSFKDNSYLYFVMQFINGGDLFTHLRKCNKLKESASKFYAVQVLIALEFLHYCDVLYRDLKPENILIDFKGYIKIADLGFCKIVKGRTWTLCGTPEYIAPEIILSKGYSKPVDWWSFGCLLFEMTAGVPPFRSSDPMRIFEKIISCRYKCPGSFTVELTDLIGHLLQVDLSRRYGNLQNGVNDIKNHKWFQGIDFDAIYNRQVEPPFKPDIKGPGDYTNFEDWGSELNTLEVSPEELYAVEFKMF